MTDQNENKKEYPQGSSVPDIAREVEIFVQHIDSLVSTLPSIMLSITLAEQEAADQFLTYAEKYGELTEKTEESANYVFKPPYDVRASLLSKKVKQADVSKRVIPRVLVLALISQFDAFLGRLLRVIFLLRPELMTTSERSLTLSQLLDLGTIESATEYLLEKEIETVLRKSHTEQFSWMENKFSVKLREGLDSWPTFIELTERRNLFAHSNGIVSDQYLAVCRNNAVQLATDCIRGFELTVDPKYFKCAYRCIYEIGIKLSQVLWRKLRSDQLEAADNNLIGLTYDLLVAGKNKLACKILDFACVTLKKHASEHCRLVMTINRAQAYKWAGNADKCRSILDGQDWSACGPEFHLSNAVLRDDFETAAKIMRSIGAKGRLRETDYQEWPLFKDFRNSEVFKSVYKEVFEEPFVHIEKVLKADEIDRRRKVLDHLRRMVEEEYEQPDVVH